MANFILEPSVGKYLQDLLPARDAVLQEARHARTELDKARSLLY